MHINKQIPHWLVIVGKNGAGKTTVANMLHKWYKESYFDVLTVNEEELEISYTRKDTYLSSEMQRIRAAGLRQPTIVRTSLWFLRLFEKLDRDVCVLHDTKGISLLELEAMLSLVESGLIKSIKVLEIDTRDEACRERKAGDTQATMGKLQQWSDESGAIIDAAAQAGIHMRIQNNGTLKDLERKLAVQFDFVKQYQI
jgi:adenylate kinase family enzyme